MPDKPDARGQHRPHPQAMAAAYLEFDLQREIDELTSEAGWAGGQNAKTLAKYDNLRLVLTALRARATMAEHRTAGRITIQTIRGHLRVRADGRTFDLTAGRLLALDHGIAHDVEAIDDSIFLLTIAWPTSER